MPKVDSKLIAKLAGVSRSTVSRVLNGYSDISEKTKEKILKIIKENGYYPNMSAQILAGKDSKIIGLLVYTGKSSKNANERKKLTESLYYSQLIAEIIDEAENLGYLVLISYISNKKNDWKRIFENGVIDGAIVISGGKKIEEIDELINSKYKIVLLDYEETIFNDFITTIKSDHFYGGYKATEYLIKKGHKNILHLTGEIKRKITLQRVRGYLECLKDNNILENKILVAKYDQKVAYNVIDAYIKSNKDFKYTAIFAGNDYIALGAIRALNDNKINVPNKVSVIGYDNMELCEYTSPKITSVNHLGEGIAKKALIELINILNGKKGGEKEIKLSIFERESVLKIF